MSNGNILGTVVGGIVVIGVTKALLDPKKKRRRRRRKK